MKVLIPSIASASSDKKNDSMERFVQPLAQSGVSQHKIFFEHGEDGEAEMQQVLEEYGYVLDAEGETVFLQQDGETVGELEVRDSGTFFVMYGE
jgi:hypothetical protein